MKSLAFALSLLLVALLLIGCQSPQAPEQAIQGNSSLMKPDNCATIQSGTILYGAGHYLAGQPITTGYNGYGYNYQAHEFRGYYANVYLGSDGFPPFNGDDASYLVQNPTVVAKWYWPYRMYEIAMKWNEAWLSNKDCDGDGKLDRHLGFPTYIGSGAWEMYSEKMGGPAGYTYMSKIVAVPADAVLIAGVWYNAAGVEIGPAIWGEFAVIQEVIGGSEGGGLLYRSQDHTGLGGW
jgi:hypothetical protein